MGQAKARRTAAQAILADAKPSILPDVATARRQGKKMLSHLINPSEVGFTMTALETAKQNDANLIVHVLPVTPKDGESFITYAIGKNIQKLQALKDGDPTFICLIIVNCRDGEKQKIEVESKLREYSFIQPLDLSHEKSINKDGSRKMSPTIPHHQTMIPGEELIAHFLHLPEEAQQSDANVKFQRYHLRDHEEAVRFCVALCDKGGFGTVINKSVRILAHWMRIAEMLLSDFETGPIELSECDMPYDEPRIEVRIDGLDVQTANPRMIGGYN